MKEINFKKLAKRGLLVLPDLIGLYTSAVAVTDVSGPDQTHLDDEGSKLEENPTADEIGFFAGLNEQKFKEFLNFLAAAMVNQEFFCQPTDEENYQQFKDFVLNELDQEEEVNQVWTMDFLADFYTTLAIIGSSSSAHAYLIREQIYNIFDRNQPMTTSEMEEISIETISPDCQSYFWSQLARFLSEIRNSNDHMLVVENEQ